MSGGEPCGTGGRALPWLILLSLSHCGAAEPTFLLGQEVRGWEIQVLLGEASKHQEPEGCE